MVHDFLAHSVIQHSLVGMSGQGWTISLGLVLWVCAKSADAATYPIVAAICNATSPFQVWSVQGSRILLAANDSRCVAWTETAGRLSSDPLELEPCLPVAQTEDNQAFFVNSTSHEIVVANGTRAQGLRMDVSKYGDNGPGSIVWVDNRTGAANQRWTLTPVNGRIRADSHNTVTNMNVLIVSQQTGWKQNQLCLAVSAKPTPPPTPPPPPLIAFDWLDPCQNVSLAAYPWCDMTKSANDRASTLISAMTLDEKVQTMVPFARPIGRLRVPPIWTTDALHGAFSSPHYPYVLREARILGARAVALDSQRLCCADFHSSMRAAIAPSSLRQSRMLPPLTETT